MPLFFPVGILAFLVGKNTVVLNVVCKEAMLSWVQSSCETHAF